ncbi:DUF58 domain-containing protein [Microbacterium aureliae]
MRRLWPFTARGAGAVVLSVGAFIAASELGLVELVYFGMLLVAVVAASLISLYLTQRTDDVVRALHPDTVAVGSEAEVVVRVAARSAVPTAAGSWQDSLPRGLAGEARGVFPSLGSGLRRAERIVELAYRVRGVRRGIHSIGPLSVSSTDPFGLVRRRTVLGARTRVTVAPAVVELAPLSNLAGESGGLLHVSTDQLGQGSDNLSPRSYLPGDSMRRIHWRATAHRDELMVRQEEQESTPEAVVVLDRGVLRWSPEAMDAPGADADFEAGVSACVSAVARLVRDGYGAEVADSDGTLLADRIDGGDLAEIDHLVTDFATLTARRDDTFARLPLLFAGGSTGPVVIIVGRLDAVDVDAIAGLVHHCTLAVLLAAAPAAGALDRAAALGFHAARLDADADLADVWSDAVHTGVRHVAG